MHIRELKSRKAKYGWDMGRLTLGIVSELARFKDLLETTWTDGYIFESVGMHGNELRFYTDSDDIALWMRSYWNNQP